jgi:hypothetical protein
VRIGQPHQIEHPLHRAILAGNTVERVEHDIGLGLGEAQRNVAAHVDPGDAMALALERIGHAAPARQRDRALVGPAAHQDCDMEFGKSHGRPTRWISHSRLTPEWA